MIIKFEDLSKSDLIQGAIYKGGPFKTPMQNDPISKIFIIEGCEKSIGNQGGFRKTSKENNGKKVTNTVAFIVIVDGGNQTEWPNSFDEETRVFTYYGDNRIPGNHILKTKNLGNELLLKMFTKAYTSKEEREDIPPIFIFKATGDGTNKKFVGLAVPGVEGKSMEESLQRKTFESANGSFENYIAKFTVLNTSDKAIKREWLKDLKDINKSFSENAPKEWNDFIINGLNDINKKLNKEYVKVDGIVEYNSYVISNFNVSETIEYIHNYIKANGFIYDKELINNFYISLRTKPFVILSGISGTGKSKLVELFANAIGATANNGRFKLIPVKPDWSDATDLLGYRDIEGKFNPGIITEIAYKAMLNPDVPYFICLDEMNLARVEYYFSDILSLMETRRINDDGEIITNNLLSKEQIGRDEVAFNKYGDVYIPQNLYVIGTVNMDETTFPFSKKVLDRANTIEFNEVNLNYSFDDIFEVSEDVEAKVYHNDLLKSQYLKISQCKDYKDIAKEVIDELIKINNVLEVYNQHFGYRVRDEIVFYMIYAVREKLMSFEEAFDNCVVQKILPKISGSSNETLDILKELFSLFNDYKFDASGYLEENDIKAMEKAIKSNNDSGIIKYKLTNKKLIYMIRRFLRDGFTTFWQ